MFASRHVSVARRHNNNWEKLHWALLNQTPLYIQLAERAGKVFSVPLNRKTLRLNSVLQNEVYHIQGAYLHNAKYPCFSPTKKLLVLGWKIKFLRGGQFLFNWRYPLKDTWISEPVFRCEQDERTDNMFKLATLLALGTAYLLMFAWIDEVSAVNATVSLSYIERQHLAALWR